VIQAIVDRVTATCPSLGPVGQAEDLDALDKGTAPKSGSTFVLPFTDDGLANTLMSGGFRQEVETRFLVAVVIRKHNDTKGGQRVATFDAIKAELESTLFGWEFDEHSDPVSFVSARALPRGNGVTIYVQTWRTSRHLRRT
jgi:hypothetical protein